MMRYGGRATSPACRAPFPSEGPDPIVPRPLPAGERAGDSRVRGTGRSPGGRGSSARSRFSASSRSRISSSVRSPAASRRPRRRPGPAARGPAPARSDAGCRGSSACASSGPPPLAPGGLSQASRSRTSSRAAWATSPPVTTSPLCPLSTREGGRGQGVRSASGTSRSTSSACSGSRSPPELRPMPQRPQLVRTRVQHAEEVVVVAGEDNQLAGLARRLRSTRRRAGAWRALASQ